jgi:hypothetical protein
MRLFEIGHGISSPMSPAALVSGLYRYAPILMLPSDRFADKTRDKIISGMAGEDCPFKGSDLDE